MDVLDRIKQIRNLDGEKNLKPSPYLKNKYVNEFGDEKPVVLRNYQKAGILNLCSVERTLLGDDTGLGKAQPIDAKVLTLNGWVSIGNIKIGDNVIGSNGKPTKVLGVFPQGVKQVYKIHLSDGSSTECCEDHLWTVKYDNKKWCVHTLKEILSTGLKIRKTPTELRWFIPVVEPIKFRKKKLPVDPYVVGILSSNSKYIFNIQNYLFSSINQRTELLNGLMDTKGSISMDGSIQFLSSNSELTNNFIHLVRSLGGICQIETKGKKCVITIRLPDFITPFSIPEKIKFYNLRTTYSPSRAIAKVEKTRQCECVCIKVDAPDHLYVTDDFIVTHNTIQALSAVGYVWLKEPEYVPIILTKKSSLFQWAAEIEKFMINMKAVTIDDKPYIRHQIYEDFFSNYDMKNKQLLILTYDMFLRDLNETVIRDREVKPTKDLKKQVSLIKKELKTVKDNFPFKKEAFQSYFNQKGYNCFDYLKSRLHGTSEIEKPVLWTHEDENVLQDIIKTRKQIHKLEEKLEELKDKEAPPLQVPGLKSHIEELLTNSDIKLMFIMDEIHTVKNHKGKIHQAVYDVAKMSSRVIGMTATPVKNRLMEFFSIFRIIQPDLFPKITQFQNNYCVMKLQRIKGGRQIPIVVGYKNLDNFVEQIEPYYLRRAKHEVAKELPELVTRELICTLSDEQEELYDIAELGLLNKSDESDEDNQASVLSSLVMVQQAANAPPLISDENGVPFTGSSSKINTIIDCLTEDLSGVKTIIFSRFEKMISLIGKELEKHDINYVRITGKENKAKDREDNKNKFQDPQSGVDVILITSAGSESINLQSAEHLIFVDSPWAWGDYLQSIGRFVRIGSQHQMVVATHLIAYRQNGSKTIDHHVLKKLRSKKALSDKVAGEALKGGLDFVSPDEIMDLFNAIRNEHTNHPIGDVKKKAQTAKTIHSTSSKTKKLQQTVEPKPNLEPEHKILRIDIDFSDI